MEKLRTIIVIDQGTTVHVPFSSLKTEYLAQRSAELETLQQMAGLNTILRKYGRVH